ncbi:hypothetical protein RFN28_19635 [Mesorhizobium sp. VK24D]|uniref:Uncharacterized protein n=1 Tax=Mesorhizobium album TaxID=3072314 RepID=A0ABU4Y130_9HYPH|nr:hypothetical protein [Mesorhizobium sp. VK24D]MDX8480660.1 hypothetical protein [Mesorhizobium sp. VK24D]
MAKGQKHNNREIRKPKQAKAAPKADSPLGNAIKLPANANRPRGKGQN